VGDPRITDSLIGRNVTILNHENNLLKGKRFIIGDPSKLII
jgi:hypothetical protein